MPVNEITMTEEEIQRFRNKYNVQPSPVAFGDDVGSRKARLRTLASGVDDVPEETPKRGALGGIFDFFKEQGEDIGEGLVSLKDAFAQRGKEFSQTFEELRGGEIGLGEAAFRTVGDVIGTAGDVIGSTLITGLKLIPGTEKTAQYVLNTDLGQQGLIKLREGMEAYEEWAQKNPRTAENLEAVVNIAEIIPITKGPRLAARALEEVGEVAVPTARAIKKGAEELTEEVVDVTGRVTRGVGKKVSGVGEFATAQATGLSPDTIRTIIKSPDVLTQAQKSGLDRVALSSRVKGAITRRLDELESTGKEYDIIRKSEEIVPVPSNLARDILKGKNIEFDENFNLIKTAETPPLTDADAKAISSFLQQYGDLEELSANAFLNTRKALDQMAKWEQGKSDLPTSISKAIRKEYDKLGKKELAGLRKLDEKFAPEKKVLKQIQKEYLTKDGELKDAALTKIANLTNKGREQALTRLEKIVPNIREDIHILRAIEDIEIAKGQKVGAYMRGVSGGVVGGFAGGPLGAIVGMIVSAPQVIVPLLKSFGKLKNYTDEFIDKVIKKVTTGKKLQVAEKKFLEETVQDVVTKSPKAKAVTDTAKTKAVKATTDLAEEAKKYKSADEFIEGQGEPIYRGQEDEFFSLDTTREKFLPHMKGTSFTKTLESAKNYGDNIIEAYIPKNKILVGKDLLPDDLAKIKSKIKKMEFEDYVEGDLFEDIVGEIHQYAEDMGKEAIDLTKFFPPSKIDDEIRILDSSKSFKTKSQLKQIWEQANKGAKTKAVKGAKTKYDTPEIVKAREDQSKIKSTHLINTPERIKLREDITQKLYGAGAKNKHRVVDIVIGPPAAGKSRVFADPLAKKSGSIIIDNDEAKKLLPEFGGGFYAGAVHEEASDIGVNVLKRAIENGDNIVYPAVGKTESNLDKLIDKFKEKGYTVNLRLNEVSPDEAAKRAIKRFEKEGRFVDPDYIINSVGTKPTQNYQKFKNDSRIKLYEHRNNEVPRGKEPRLIEQGSN